MASIAERLGLDRKPVFLMDGTAFIYRGFFASRHIQRSDGYPTNALVVVTRILLRLLREENPKHFLFAMDGKGKAFAMPSTRITRPIARVCRKIWQSRSNL